MNNDKLIQHIVVQDKIIQHIVVQDKIIKDYEELLKKIMSDECMGLKTNINWEEKFKNLRKKTIYFTVLNDIIKDKEEQDFTILDNNKYIDKKIVEGEDAVVYLCFINQDGFAVKKIKNCVNENFMIEVELMNKTTTLNKSGIPHLPIMLDYDINNCLIVLPRAICTVYDLLDHSFDVFSETSNEKDHFILKQLVVYLLKQMIVSIFIFHKNMNKLHCDAHLGNFFIFAEKKCVNYHYTDINLKINGITTHAQYHDKKIYPYVCIYDLGPINNEECTNFAYDYLRLFDDFGLNMLYNKYHYALENYLGEWEFIEKCNDFINGSGDKKSITICRELFKILPKNVSNKNQTFTFKTSI